MERARQKFTNLKSQKIDWTLTIYIKNYFTAYFTINKSSALSVIK